MKKFVGSQNASCITADNVKVWGQNFGNTDLSFGYFYKNGSAFPFDEGIILSTGKVSLAPGPNDNVQSEYFSRWDGDIDLSEMLMTAGMNTNNVRNATYLEFDFISNQSDVISFDYMFLSEEYRSSNCYFSDVFAFLIKKADNTEYYRNIALVPGTNIPVTSTTVSGITCNNQDGHPAFFGNYNPDISGSTSATNFNGQTKVLKAIATVEKGVKYHIKLVIADHGDKDGIFDSAVFLKAGSFTGNIDIGKDLTIGNADPLCKGVPYIITPNPPIIDASAKYSWFKNGTQILDSFGDPITTDYYEVNNEDGVFSLDVELASGCKLAGSVTVEKAPVAQVTTSPIVVCDYDFNGSFAAKLSRFDNEIIKNYDKAVFYRTYSRTPGGTAINPDTEFDFTSNPQTLYLSVNSKTCAPEIYPIQFTFGTKLSFNAVQEQDICDNDIDGSQTFDLADYIKIITNETDVVPTYFDTEAKAKIGGASTISSSQTISADAKFFIRIEKDEFCPNYKEIRFKFKKPKESENLKNMKTIICKGEEINLDAGDGLDPVTGLRFTSYKWNTGQTTQEIKKVGPGDYWVELGFNGCVYKQFVKITEAEDPVIDNVVIEGTTVTVLVSGGTSPYLYALDNGLYQSSSNFTDVDLGTHTIYVRGADGCAVVAKEFSLINTQNVITPNNDGVNDFINYSSLLNKLDPKFEVYDRNGVLVFKGDTSNKFIWNGTSNGRKLPTSSYWYILEWNESGNPKRVQNTGWILLKNRNSE
ncbi:choice-of-anchor L domain-containing protein [Chryseobacterium sp. KACC 21268]|nr:choice-of-anchor L domain-containing protein [Chryseobacterium sp. KACC 21268]